MLQVGGRLARQGRGGVFNVDQYLPNYFEIAATIWPQKPTAGWKGNAYVIFDYFSPTDFKFAGIDVVDQQDRDGPPHAAGWVVDAPAHPGERRSDTSTHAGRTTATLTVVVTATSHLHSPRADRRRRPTGFNQGLVGVGSNNSAAHGQLAVQVLPPQSRSSPPRTSTTGSPTSSPAGRAGTWRVPVAASAGSRRRRGRDERHEPCLPLARRHGPPLSTRRPGPAPAATGFIFDYYGATTSST